jgi:hypothetical protein
LRSRRIDLNGLLVFNSLGDRRIVKKKRHFCSISALLDIFGPSTYSSSTDKVSFASAVSTIASVFPTAAAATAVPVQAPRTAGGP